VALELKPFLEQILGLLEEDFPQQLKKMTQQADGVTYLQTLDKERAFIIVKDGRIEIARKAKKRDINVRVHLSRKCLFDMLEGRRTLAEELMSGDLTVFGDPATLLRCYAIWERVISLARTSPRFYFLTYRLR
jgi:hypothetical protein